MNSKFIASTVVAIAALTGASAFAQTSLSGEAATAVVFPITASNVTRAQVQAEYLQARQAGNVAVSDEAAFAPVMASPSTVSRAEVRAEASHWVIMDGSNRMIYR